MGSGYYPLRENDWDGRASLLHLLDELEHKNERIKDNAMEGSDGQFDNSTYDGIYSEKVRLGIQLLRAALGAQKKE